MAAQEDLGNTHGTGSTLWKVWGKLLARPLCTSQHGTSLPVGSQDVQKPFKASRRCNESVRMRVWPSLTVQGELRLMSSHS